MAEGRRSRRDRYQNMVDASLCRDGEVMLEGIPILAHMVLVRRSRPQTIVDDPVGGLLAGRFFSKEDAPQKVEHLFSRGIILRRQATHALRSNAFSMLPEHDPESLSDLCEALRNPVTFRICPASRMLGSVHGHFFGASGQAIENPLFPLNHFVDREEAEKALALSIEFGDIRFTNPFSAARLRRQIAGARFAPREANSVVLMVRVRLILA